jgi:hypothetical protein
MITAFVGTLLAGIAIYVARVRNQKKNVNSILNYGSSRKSRAAAVRKLRSRPIDGEILEISNNPVMLLESRNKQYSLRLNKPISPA